MPEQVYPTEGNEHIDRTLERFPLRTYFLYGIVAKRASAPANTEACSSLHAAFYLGLATQLLEACKPASGAGFVDPLYGWRDGPGKAAIK